jgi:hypothetical protein
MLGWYCMNPGKSRTPSDVMLYVELSKYSEERVPGGVRPSMQKHVRKQAELR